MIGHQAVLSRRIGRAAGQVIPTASALVALAATFQRTVAGTAGDAA